MDISAANRDYVLKTIKERNIHFIRMWFTDVNGQIKSFAVTPNEIANAFEEGIGFDGGIINGFGDGGQCDLLAFPDADTFQTLPWRPKDNGVARMFCNIVSPDGKPFDCDPRHILRKQVAKAMDMGYVMNVGPEVEYYYFKDDSSVEPLDKGSYFDLTSLDAASDLRRDTILTLEQMGIPVEYSHHEVGPSQQEIDLRFDEALSMADNVMTYRLVVKEIAMKHGYHASFMPKPSSDLPGSGMHVHQSLFSLEDDSNVFYDENDPLGYGLSETAKHYIAGLLKYAPEYTVITNQNVNSYKRLVPGYEAPVYINWANRERSAFIRIPLSKPGKEVGARFEVRSPDPSCNPYLAFAVMLAAGLKGIEEKLELMPESDDVLTMTDAEREAAGIKPLPANLGEAVEAFAKSELMKEVLGEQVHAYITASKRKEWREYSAQVTQWELDRMLPLL